MKEFVRRATFVPLRRLFLGDARRESTFAFLWFINGTLGSSILVMLCGKEGTADAVACLPVARPGPAGFDLSWGVPAPLKAFAWWSPLLSLVRKFDIIDDQACCDNDSGVLVLELLPATDMSRRPALLSPMTSPNN
jgi:hypothetical protein